jgi:hypothetical protein
MRQGRIVQLATLSPWLNANFIRFPSRKKAAALF